MPSTYSTSLKLQLIGTGEQAGVWGTTTNTNLGTLLEEAITGVITIPMGDATYTLTNFNGLSDEARNAVLILNGPITAPQLLVTPSGQEKVYIVRNRTGNTVTLTTGSGSNVNIANAASEVVFTDGANFFSATQFNYIDGDLTVTGNASVGKNLVVLNQATFGANLFANSSTGQIFLPTGNTASRAATGQNGILRYNSELAIYEGFTGGTWVRFQTFPQGVYTINFLIVSGGGGGGSGSGGGGGGGFIASSLSVTPGSTYTMIVGGGGSTNGQGTDSSITGVAIATGGGAGGAFQASGATGGSGGGGASGAGDPTLSGGGGAGIAGQGFSGGGGGTFTGGGGGGGSAVGGTVFSDSLAGPGGAGFSNTLTGTTVYYSGGGGGGGGGSPMGGGIGGGGAGGANGGTNTGGGGGGFFNGIGTGAGGSGVIVVSVPTASYSGTTTGAPTITTSGANTILKYTVSGTYTA